MAKKITDRLMSKGLPAIGGGVGSKLITSKVNPWIMEMIEGTGADKKTLEPKTAKWVNTGLDLLPAIGGLFLLNDKNDEWSYLGAGMIGASAGDAMQKAMPEFLSDDNNVLANDIDELLKRARRQAKASQS